MDNQNKNDKEKFPNRKSMRLKGYDYSNAGAYFLTLCTEHRKNFFGKIVRESLMTAPYVQLSPYGKVLLYQIEEINRTYSHLQIEHFSIMPNHLHMIVTVYENGSSGTPTPTSDVKNGSSRTPTPTNAVISAFVSTLKRFTNQKAGVKLWQRGYYDHILRDEDDYLRAWQYIEENPFGKE